MFAPDEADDAFHETDLQRRIQLHLHELGAARWKSQTVDDGFVLQKTEDTWRWVARLWPGCDGPDLNMAESQGGESTNGPAVLVVAGSESHRILKDQPERVDWFCRSLVD